MTMRVTQAGIALIHHAEDCKLVAYDDNGHKPGGTWTIGWGTTKYPRWHLGGRRVRKGDICTRAEADSFFSYRIAYTEDQVDLFTRDDLLPRQFDALCCLTYNIGEPRYGTSTVRRLVNLNPNGDEATLREAWQRWHYQEGEPIYGLWVRRHRELDFYFGVTTDEPDYPHLRVA